MKRMLLALVFCSLCLSLPAQSEKERLAQLPPQHRKWLSEEVAYIITKVEREVFLQLGSDQERETFISAFWKQRNPNPNLPENEFRKEHYRRLAYANNWFGKDSPAPGWRTDMGRVYITLGEPKAIERYESDNELYPTVVWFYQGMANKGLPDSFNVVFFKQDGIGEYELYSPVKFGPQALMRNYEGDLTSYESAYYALMNIQPQLAAVSLSLISGEPVGVTPSLASELLIREKIPETPQRAIKDIYASNFLKFRGQVEIDYADNYIESSGQLDVFQDRGGHYFVHYLIEPRRLSLEEHQGRFYTTLEVSGNVSDDSGRMLTQISRRIPVELSAGQMQRVKDKLFSFQDMLPVIAGKWRLTVFLKNLTTKEFTTLDREFVIPEREKLELAPLLLANRKADAAGIAAHKPYRFGNTHLLPSPRNDFLAGDELTVFTQLRGLDERLRASGVLEYALARRGETVLRRELPLRGCRTLPDVDETFPLQGQSAAYYTVTVTLLGEGRKALAAQSADFFITPQPALPRPWVLSVPTAAGDEALFLNELGRQYVQARRPDKARPLLEEAFHRDPNSPRFGIDLCNVLLQAGEHARVKAIAQPMVGERSRFEFSLVLGQALQGLGEYQEAIAQYAEHVTRFGARVEVFNRIGECYQRLGNAAEALKAWEKSLSLNPKQPAVAEKVAALKKNQP